MDFFINPHVSRYLWVDGAAERKRDDIVTDVEDRMSAMLAARSFAYELAHGLMGHEPTREIIEVASSDAAFAAYGVFEAFGSERYAVSVDELEEALKKVDDVSHMTSLYTHIFIGPDELSAPPWESVYMSKEGLLFQQCTLDVRRAYQEEGLIPDGYPHVADDHVALECCFMAKLGIRAHGFLDEGRWNEAVSILNVSREFLADHMARWVPQYASRMQEDANASIYGKMATWLAEFVTADMLFLGQMDIESFDERHRSDRDG